MLPASANQPKKLIPPGKDVLEKLSSKLELTVKETGVVKKKLDVKFGGTNWAP